MCAIVTAVTFRFSVAVNLNRVRAAMRLLSRVFVTLLAEGRIVFWCCHRVLFPRLRRR